MTKEQIEIKKLKKLAENEIVQWLSVLSELERLDHYANTTKKIEKAFKSVKKNDPKAVLTGSASGTVGTKVSKLSK
jgi:alpha-mannosidase